MKKILLICTAVLLFCTQFTFAGAKEVEANGTLKSALYKEFGSASAVKWYSDDNQTFMARFTLNERSVTAYFDKTGNLLATRRYLSTESLPLVVSNKLAKRYPKDEIRWVVEFESGGNIVYYVTLEGASTWKVIRSNTEGDLFVQENMKKA
jgi:hypothetical protein